MVRTSFCLDKNELKKGTWTPEEDKKLIDYVTRYGHWNWNLLPRFAGLARSGKSCRLRWLNYLRPNIKRGNYTQEEEETITKMIQRGKRWSAIAAQLPGRTDNEIKNYWHTKLKKKFQHNNSSITHETPQNSKSKDHSHAEPIMLNNKTGPSQSTDYSCSSFESWSEFRSQEVVPDEGEFAFMDAFEEEAIMSRSFWLEPHVADISLYVPSEILVVDETEWFSPVCDVDLWAHD